MEKPTNISNLITAAAEAPVSETVSNVLSHAKDILSEAGPSKIAEGMKGVVAAVSDVDRAVFDHLSNLLQHGREAIEEGKDKMQEGTEEASKDAAAIRKESRLLYNNAKDLVLQLLASQDFRVAVNDSLDLIQDLLVYGMQTAKEKTNEKLTEVTEGAGEEEEEAHDDEGKKRKGGRGGSTRGGRGGRTKKAKAEKAVEATAAAAEEVKARAQALAQGYVPLTDEELTQIREKTFALIKRLSSNESFRRALDSVFNIFLHLKNIASIAADKAVEATKENEALFRLWNDARVLVEDFLQGTKLDEWTATLWDVVKQVVSEPRLERMASNWRDFITEAASKPQLLLEAASISRFNELLQNSRKLISDLNVGETFSKWFRVSKGIVSLIANNPATNKLQNAARQLVTDLLLDEHGFPALKTEIFSQMRGLMVNLVMAELKHIPIPKLEGSVDNYDYRFEGMKLYGFDLLPDHIHLKIENEIRVDVPHGSTEKARANITIRCTNIKTQLENIHFWFRRKGLVTIEDEGTAVVALKGEGASITLQLRLDARRFEESHKIFEVKNVLCELDDLHIHVIESKYDWLLNFLTGLWSGTIKRMLESKVEESLKNTVDSLERQLELLLTKSPADALLSALRS